MVSKRQLENDSMELYRRVNMLERGFKDTDAGGRADAAVRRVQKLETRVAELGAQLLTHHEVVLVNDANRTSFGGTRIVSKLDIYKGKTPQGERIHAVRAPFKSETEYHMEGKGYTDEEFNRGE